MQETKRNDADEDYDGHVEPTEADKGFIDDDLADEEDAEKEDARLRSV